MKSLRFFLSFLLFIVFLPFPGQTTPAVTDSNLTLLGYFPTGACQGVFPFRTDYLAIGSGRGVRILDIHNREAIYTTAVIPAGGIVSDVFVSGTYLFFTTEGSGYTVDEHFTAGLTVVDVSNPEQPQKLGEIATDSPCFAVAVFNGYAYVARDNEIAIYNINIPESPTYAESIAIQAVSHELYLDAPYLYVGTENNTVLIYLINDPLNPVKVGEITTNFPIKSIYVADTLAVLNGDPYAVPLYSVADPANPYLLTQITSDDYTEAYYSSAIFGDELYLSGNVSGTQQEFLFKIYDISRPNQPILKSAATDSAHLYHSTDQGTQIVPYTSHAFVSTQNGLKVVNVTNSQSPFIAVQYPTNLVPRAVQVKGSLAYVAFNATNGNWSGLTIWNIDNPATLREVGWLPLFPAKNSQLGMSLTADRCYVAYAASPNDSACGFQIVDISNPSHPELTRFVRTTKDSRPIILAQNNTLYMVTSNNDTIHQMDISNPDYPHTTGKIAIDVWQYGFITSVTADENYIYFGTTTGLLIFEVNSSGGLQMSGYAPLPSGYSNTNGVSIDGTTAYLATASGLVAVDVSNPTAPTVIAQHSGYFLAVAAANGDVFAAASNRIELYQRTGDSFTRTGYFYNYRDYPYCLWEANGKLYAGYEGLMIFQQGTPTAIAPPLTPVAQQVVLYPNYPNPFNPTTTIAFWLPRATLVKLTVFNILGESVAQLLNGYLPAGFHRVVFQAHQLPSGVYYYRLTTGNKESRMGRMVLIR